ncbi:MAG: 3-keto-5-aminohexanoate cleavage protein [Proteobacteria bacterium]|nr:3-keto-5-aminohexanoate cleavage protein [Pseudomonadota bacterium]
MPNKVIISCAVTGGAATTPDINPAVPVTPEEIANSALEAWRAGAAITHIHVRDPETKRGTMEVKYYRDVVERMRATDTDVILNLTTGPGAFFVPGEDEPAIGDPISIFKKPEVRVKHVEELRPEICSLDVATMNMGERVFMNTPPHLTEMAIKIKAAGVKPEMECFDVGHVMLANHLIETGVIESPPLFQLCLGISYGCPATVESILHMRSLLPKDAHWAAFGISRHEMPIVAAAIQMGGHVRVGLEDNLYLDRGVLASSNAVLVERAAQIIRLLGYEVATPDEAREILGLGTGAAKSAAAE